MQNPDQPERWGILGGAFDPTHNGHLHLSRQVLYATGLHGVVFVPSHSHPFKNHFAADYDDRVSMLRIALAPHADFEVCEIEKEEGLPGHTLATVLALKQRFPSREFFFIMGEDNLPDFELWHEPKRLLEELVFLVGGRPPHQALAHSRFPKDRMCPVDIEMLDVSSTDIRQKIAEGEIDQIKRLVPEVVCEYIIQKGLYR